MWSPPTGVYDSFQLFSIEATAAGETVTVYTFSEPQYASPVINVYWDDATLRAVGGSTSSNTQAAAAPTASSGNATPTAAQTSGFGGIVPQLPLADGSQWHTVKAGETLGGIGRAYDVRTQTIRELNQLTSDVLRVGQELLIREFTETPTPEITPSAIPPTPTPQEVAEAQTGEICLTLFEDTNENGLREASEPILSNGRVNLSGAASASYVTEASGDPYCFVDLLPGDYEVTTDPPDGYHHTGIPSLPVTLSSGGAISLSFGAAADVPAQLASPEPEPMVLGLPRGLSIGLIAGAGALLVVLAGVATFFLMKSHSRGNTEPHHET